jgi:hypothetical protein
MGMGALPEFSCMIPQEKEARSSLFDEDWALFAPPQGANKPAAPS